MQSTTDPGAAFSATWTATPKVEPPEMPVKMDLLKVAPKTASDLECPHGVQFYDVVEGGKTSPRAAWSYEAPQAKMKPVDHWIGFWEDVTVA